MKRILVSAVLIAISTSVFADPDKWRSPFVGAPGGTPVSPLDAEKQAKVMSQELAAWREGGHHWNVPGFRSAERAR